MPVEQHDKVVGIFAHVDAGKTSLTEAVLYHAGVVKKAGRVDHKDTFLDTHPIEKERGITIFSKQAVFSMGTTRYTLIDTPGHVDFAAEMERAAAVLDYAVLVISAMRGVQNHTETIWRMLKKRKVPTLLFVNKMDWPEADRGDMIRSIRDRLGDCCIAVKGILSPEAMPDEFCSELALEREEWLEAYLAGTFTERDWFAAARKEIEECRINPCFFGSALMDSGVEEWLESFYQISRGIDAEKGTVDPEKEEFGGRVYKVLYDGSGRRLVFLKVTGGSLRVKDMVALRNKDAGKVNQIRIYHGDRYDTAEIAGRGCLCAVTGLTGVVPGEAVGCERLDNRSEFKPVLTVKVFFPEGCSLMQALEQMKRMEEEMPELDVHFNEALGQIELHIMGEIQLEVLKELLLERYGAEVRFGACEILYKETIRGKVTGYGHFEPLRHYAEVHVSIEAGVPGSGVTTACEVNVNDLDRNYQNLILTHIKEKEHKGMLTGSALTDVKITLTAGRAHLKHTEGGDFREATYRAVRQGLHKAEGVLLEPFYAFRVEVQLNHLGRVVSDVRKRYGRVEGQGTVCGRAVLTGFAPVESFRDYPLELVNYTRGDGVISLEYSGYEPCHNAEEVIKHIGYDGDRDAENPSGSMFCSHGAGFYVAWDEVEGYMHIKG